MVVRWLIRIAGLIQIVLGVLLWTGNARNMVGTHMLIGFALVIFLWVMAGIAAYRGVSRGLIALVIVWSLIMPALGVAQSGLLLGPLHFVIQIVHLVIGMAAVGLSEAMARRMEPGAQAATGVAPRDARSGAAR